jgi:hypothetical protein
LKNFGPTLKKLWPGGETQRRKVRREAQRSSFSSGSSAFSAPLSLGLVFKKQGDGKVGLSLAPGFSPVWNRRARTSRFNGFPDRPKAAEAAEPTDRHKSPG